MSSDAREAVEEAKRKLFEAFHVYLDWQAEFGDDDADQESFADWVVDLSEELEEELDQRGG